ncbi:MAG: N-acetylneuraminate synthase [Caldimonas sp.]
MSCFFIAEAGVNHNGSLDLALKLVDAAADAGADAVKFQTFRADELVAPGTAKAEYQTATTGQGDQHSMIRALELRESDYEVLARRCAMRGIEFMSTPFDTWAADLLIRLGMKRIKIPSGEITNRPFLEHLAGTGLPLILSTGMATLAEVETAKSWLVEARNAAAHDADPAGVLTVLHCTSNYPARPEDVNLSAMLTMQRVLQLPVGYSDHTLGIEISLAAVALGATVIEKHFTLDRDLPGPDHQASLDLDALGALITGIRSISSAWGDGVKAPRPSELPVRALVRRSAFATRRLEVGDRIADADLRYLRPGTGIGPEHSHELRQRFLARAVEAGQMLSWSDLR